TLPLAAQAGIAGAANIAAYAASILIYPPLYKRLRVRPRPPAGGSQQRRRGAKDQDSGAKDEPDDASAGGGGRKTP
ncbi:MAG: hypothetical protein ABR498_06055, partial [Candidatus Dormibacteria bacterium]